MNRWPKMDRFTVRLFFTLQSVNRSVIRLFSKNEYVVPGSGPDSTCATGVEMLHSQESTLEEDSGEEGVIRLLQPAGINTTAQAPTGGTVSTTHVHVTFERS